MNERKVEHLGDLEEFKLLDDLGRWVRDNEAQDAQDEPDFVPMPRERREALLDRVLGPAGRDEPAATLGEPTTIPTHEAAANDRGRLSAILGSLVAAAAVAAFFTVQSASPPDAAGHHPPAGDERPGFASVRIDGGGPVPAHLGGGSEPADRLCLGRPLRLSLAAAKGQRIDPATPLELVVAATPPWGPGHRLTFEIGHDERFTWAGGGRALVYEGPLEDLVPLTHGPWTLELSAGPPGACSRRDDRSACITLPAQTIEVVAEGSCDAPR